MRRHFFYCLSVVLSVSLGLACSLSFSLALFPSLLLSCSLSLSLALSSPLSCSLSCLLSLCPSYSVLSHLPSVFYWTSSYVRSSMLAQFCLFARFVLPPHLSDCALWFHRCSSPFRCFPPWHYFALHVQLCSRLLGLILWTTSGILVLFSSPFSCFHKCTMPYPFNYVSFFQLLTLWCHRQHCPIAFLSSLVFPSS